MVRTLLRWIAAFAALLAVAFATVGSATADDYGLPTVAAVSLHAKYEAPDGKPFLVGGLKMPANLTANVASITCPSGARPNLVGGPDGSPECIFPQAVTDAEVTVTGRAPWPNSFAVSPFWSFDGGTYVTGDPVMATSPGLAFDITVPTGASCATRSARVLFFPKGHGAVSALAGVSADTNPNVVVYAGTGKQFTEEQLLLNADDSGTATADGQCTAKPVSTAGTLAASRRGTTKAATQLTCAVPSASVLDVEPSSGTTMVVVTDGTRTYASATVGSSSKLTYDKKACTTGTLPK
jgi:hypothetical protein